MISAVFSVPSLVALAAAQADDPQSMIDAASPGDVVVIDGTRWPVIEQLVITKPLTIIGDPAPSIFGLSRPGWHESAIVLDGPGHGQVALVNLRFPEQRLDGNAMQGSDAVIGGPSFAVAKGFDELHVIDCEIHAPGWLNVYGGGIPGIHGIDASIPYVLVVQSTIRASDGDHDTCCLTPFGGTGILLSGGEVTVLDSLVQGASPYCTCVYEQGCPRYPNGLVSPSAGITGATKVFAAGSQILGGHAPELYAVWLDNAVRCDANPGPPVSDGTELVLQQDDLVLQGHLRLGSTFAVAVKTPGPVATLWFSLGAVPPYEGLPGLPRVHLDPASAVPIRVIPGGPGVVTLGIPPAPFSLVGLELAFQAFDAPDTITRPVIGVIRP